MFTDEESGSLFHGRTIQRPKHPAHPPGFDAGTDRGFKQEVEVAATHGAAPCMEVSGNRSSPLDGDVAREECIGAAYPGEGRPLAVGVEMHDLHQAVDTGIGSASTHGLDGRRGKSFQSRLQAILHRQARWLALPALVSPPAVADAQRQSHGTT